MLTKIIRSALANGKQSQSALSRQLGGAAAASSSRPPADKTSSDPLAWTDYWELIVKFLSPLWQGVVGGGSSPNSSLPATTPSIAPAPASHQQQQHRHCSGGTVSEAVFETRPYKLHKLEEAPSATAMCTRDQALLYYRQMQTIRRVESAAGNLYKEKAVRGFCHLYSGQEAICVGMTGVIRPQDSVITAYRDHGWAYVMGCSVTSVIAELTGRAQGCSRGKGGSMHMYAKNFFGGNGIVGAQVPVGAGIALAKKYLGTDGLCVAVYGDGAANQGQIFEAYNMSKLWSLPAVFVCENNGYGMGTSVDRASASFQYYTRGDYVPGIWVDGMDVLSVREAMSYCQNYCPQHGPIVLEIATYRYSGHSMSDPGTSYRTREEIQEVRQTRDPIMLWREKIVEAGLATTEELKKMDGEVRREVDEAVKVGKSDKEVAVQELAADVYYQPLEQQVRGTTPMSPYTHQRLSQPINSH